MKGDVNNVNLENTDCPLAEKCPYYSTVKENPEKLSKCPSLSGCPHFDKKDGSHLVHHDYNSKEAIKNCPHYQKSKKVLFLI
jgi:hypothetical protein